MRSFESKNILVSTHQPLHLPDKLCNLHICHRIHQYQFHLDLVLLHKCYVQDMHIHLGPHIRNMDLQYIQPLHQMLGYRLKSITIKLTLQVQLWVPYQFQQSVFALHVLPPSVHSLISLHPTQATWAVNPVSHGQEKLPTLLVQVASIPQ